MTPGTPSHRLDVRPATPADDAAVLALLQASMGWVPDDQHRQFFEWKHRQNPFGASPSWVACDGDRVVGFRTFLRWQFLHDGQVVEAVRAVDTATHPDHQGRGIFSLLTRRALDELADQGIAFVFNTPNDRSRPGYLKMGWQLVGRLPVAARPRSPAALVRLARARTPADKWSAPTTAGHPAPDILADDQAVTPLLPPTPGAGIAGGGTLVTRRTPGYLRWRYGFPPLHYRVITAPDGPAGGLVVFRLRRRGAATEAAICELLLPGELMAGAGTPPEEPGRPGPASAGTSRDRSGGTAGGPAGRGESAEPSGRPGGGRSRLARKLLGEVLRATRADHAVWLGPARWDLGLLPLPKQGPTLVWRPTGSADAEIPAAPRLPDWDLTLGDIELF